ncbi:MAG: DUF72 domain-containing protein [Candidatus Bathyarchaeia archaeon]
MGWSYSFWRGSFYPEKTPSNEFLTYYARHLNSVEVDSTFYRIPREQTVTEWRNQTPDGFVFSLKFPQTITHIKMLKDAEEVTQVFLERVSKLDEKLGALLLQLPPTFKWEHLPLLERYLGALPTHHKYAVEFRNKSLLNPSVYELLRKRNIALSWVDTPKMPPMDEVTADFVYVRWEGDRKTVVGTKGETEQNRTSDIQAWARRLKPFLTRGLEVFGYFSKYYSGNPAGDAQAFMQQVDR